MLERAQIKQLAREKLKGNVWMVFAVLLVVSIVGSAGSLAIVLGSLITMPAMLIGGVMYMMAMWRDENPEFGIIFKGFSDSLGRYIGGTLLVFLFTWLWSLLLIVPGIIKALSYSMTPFILADTDLSAQESIKKSMAITQGYKGKIFVMYLSFILWYMLCGITFGLAGIYVGPYVALSYAGLYEELKKNAIANGTW